jgi:hypothetical protein
MGGHLTDGRFTALFRSLLCKLFVLVCYARFVMVRLLTHNLLACHAKSCVGAPSAFPLAFKDASVVVREAEFNPDFMKGFISRLDWSALVSAARQVRNYV